MATSSAVRLLWNCKAPLLAAGAVVIHRTFDHVTKCEKAPNTKLQSRMTSIGHFSVVSETSVNPSIVTFVMALTGKTPLTAQEFSRLWRERGMEERHPRFHAKIESKYYTPTEDPVEEHLTESNFPVVPRADVKARIQLLQTTPWDLSEKLWHMWIAPWGELGASGLVNGSADESREEEDKKGESLLFFRAHHALGDGASMTAAFLDVLDEAAEIQQEIMDFLRKLRKRGKSTRSFWKALARKIKQIIAFLIGSLRALFYQTTLYWHMLLEKDPWTQIRKIALKQSEKDGNNKSELEAQRNVSWSKAAPLEQVKWIAEQLSSDGKKITVNDVFSACVSAAIAKQLSEHRRKIKALSPNSANIVEQKHFNIAFPVHLKGGVVLPGESVGNNLGAFVVRVPGEVADSSISQSHQRLLEVRDSLTKVKSMPTAILSHILAKGFSFVSGVLPASMIGWMYSCSNGRSIAVISNNRGLSKPVHLGGRRVEAMYGFVPLPPGIPIGVVVMSYAGDVNLTISAEPWAVPDADQFLVWVLEEYKKLLDVAKQKQHAAL